MWIPSITHGEHEPLGMCVGVRLTDFKKALVGNTYH